MQFRKLKNISFFYGSKTELNYMFKELDRLSYRSSA